MTRGTWRGPNVPLTLSEDHEVMLTSSYSHPHLLTSHWHLLLDFSRNLINKLSHSFCTSSPAQTILSHVTSMTEQLVCTNGKLKYSPCHFFFLLRSLQAFSQALLISFNKDGISKAIISLNNPSTV